MEKREEFKEKTKEEQCEAAIKIIKKLNVDDVKTIVNVATGFMLARETDKRKQEISV